MQSVEPMAMSPGSPIGPGTPLSPLAAYNQSSFLPAFLMGEPSPMSSPRTWGGLGSPVLSKSSFAYTPSSKASPAREPAPGLSHGALSGGRGDARQRELLAGRAKDKSGAPPVTGLLLSPAPTERCEVARALPSLGNLSELNASGAGGSFYSPCGARHAAPSPAQIDPFYTQGESIRPDEELDDQWITVFGFPSAATSYILQQFSQYGNILAHQVATEGNWLHIKYQTRLQAKKALSKNGKVFGSSIMVGVAPCIDKSVMEGSTESSTTLSSPAPCTSTPHTPIRPLTAAYRAATNEHEVVPRQNTPQKTGNIVAKAMEYVFGW